jgi:uncharacterized protein YcfL
MRHLSLSISLGLALLFCSTACDTAKAPGQPSSDQLVDYPRKVTLDDLQYGLVVGNAVVTPPAGAVPLAIQQAVRNTADFTVHVQYRFEYFDAKGRLMPGTGSWRFQSLPSRMEVFLESSALDPSATDWRLTIRSAR